MARNFIEFALAETALQAEFTRRKRAIPEIEDDLSALSEGYLVEFFNSKQGTEQLYKIDSKFLLELESKTEAQRVVEQTVSTSPQTPVSVYIYNGQPAVTSEKSNSTERSVESEDESTEDENNDSLTSSSGDDNVEVEDNMAKATVNVGQRAHSYEQLQRMVASAVYSKFGYETYLIATYADEAIIGDYRDGKFQKVPWSLDDNGDIEFGEATGTEMDWKSQPSQKPILLRNGEGKVGWLSVSSNIYRDSHKTRFSRSALKEAVEAMHRSGNFGELRVEHHPFSAIGKCTFSRVMGDFLIEGGEFYDTTRAQRAIETLENDENGECKTSLGFLFNSEGSVSDDGTFEKGVRIFERSITKTPSNPLTAISIAQLGEIMERAAIQERLAAIIGDEESEKLMNDTSGNKQAILEAIGFKSEADPVEVAFRNDETESKQEEEKEAEPKVEEGVQQPQTESLPEEIEITLADGRTIKAVREDIVEKASQDAKESQVEDSSLLTAIRGMIEPLVTRLDNLEQKVGQRSETPKSEEAPTRASVRPLYRVTQDGPEVTDDKEKAEVAAIVSANGQKENIWASFPGGRQ